MSGESWHEQFVVDVEPGSLEDQPQQQQHLEEPSSKRKKSHKHRRKRHPRERPLPPPRPRPKPSWLDPMSPQSAGFGTPSFDGSAHVPPEVCSSKKSSHDDSEYSQRYGSYDSRSYFYPPPPPPPMSNHSHRHHRHHHHHHRHTHHSHSHQISHSQQPQSPYHPAMMQGLPSLSQSSQSGSRMFPSDSPLLRRRQHSGLDEMDQLRRVWICMELLFLTFYTLSAIVSYLKRVYILTILWSATLICGGINVLRVMGSRRRSAPICAFCEGVFQLGIAALTAYIATSEGGWNTWFGMIVQCSCVLFAQWIPHLNFRDDDRVTKYRLFLSLMGSKYYVAFEHGLCKTGHSLFTQYETDRSVVHVAHLARGLMERSFPWSFCADSTPAVLYLVSQLFTLYVVLFVSHSLRGKIYVW